MKFLGSIFLVFVALTNYGFGFTTFPAPEEFVAERMVSFRIVSEESLAIGALPDHPKIVWLGHELSTQRSRDEAVNLLNPGQQVDRMSLRKAQELGVLNELTVKFMASRPGAIQFPPIPIIVDKKKVLINLPDSIAHENLLTKGFTQFDVFYNQEPEPPKVVRVGSHLDIDIFELIREDSGNPYFNHPDYGIDNIDWLLYHRQSRRVMGDPRFYPFSGFNSRVFIQPFQRGSKKIDGVYFQERRYRSRGFFPTEGVAKGPIFASLGVRLHSKLHVENFSVKVEPLPEKTVGGFETGLIGDWTFNLIVEPKELKVGELFTVYLTINGAGDHLNLRPLDFSSGGFSSVSKDTVVKSRKFDERWRSTFIQEIVPTGEVAYFPPVSLASFDIKSDQWLNHLLSDRIAVKGAKPTAAALQLTPVVALGEKVGRPVWLNLNPLVFALFAFSPLMPFAVLGLRKLLSVRDPAKAKRRRQRDKIVKQLKRANCPESIVDDEVVPILKEHFSLPQGVTVRELAESVQDKHPNLASILDQHAQSSFGSSVEKINYKELAKQISKIAFVLFCFVGVAQASEVTHTEALKSAATAFESGRFDEAEKIYTDLTATYVDRPDLFLNLAKTRFARGAFFHARASCYTALLMEPTNKEARKLMNEILNRLGKPALPGTSLFSARPDQYLTIAAGIWFLAFFVFMFWRSRWMIAGLILFAVLIAGFGLWRNANAYDANQYMVIAKELPREIEKGVPDWNFPSYESGEIIIPQEVTDSHARIVASGGDSFWLPLNQLEQVW